MSKGNPSSLRLAVGSASEPRSSIWNVWAYKNDVYLTTRPLGGILKASLHESGQWQISFTSEFVKAREAKDAWTTSGRHIQMWKRPPETGVGVTLAARVFIPTSELRQMEGKPKKPVCWIPVASIGHAIEVLIILRRLVKIT